MERLSMNDYQARPGISRSTLWRALKSPAHAQWALRNPEPPTAAMILGSATHTLALEPELFEKEYRIEKIDRRTKEGKEKSAAYAAAGIRLLGLDEGESVKAMVSSIRRHPIASSLLQNGQAELSFFFTDPESQIACKFRPDWFRNDGIIIDIKTTQDASPEGFQRQAWSQGYHVQAAFYLDGLNHLGIQAKSFVFVCVENEAPYAVAVYVADDDFLFMGRAAYRKGLNRIAEIPEGIEWPGYPQELLKLSPPRWAFTKEQF